MSAAPQFAFVTLVTTDEYLPGALVVAAALHDIHLSPPNPPGELEPSEFHIVCLVTPESVDVTTVKHLRKAFDVVIGVELIEAETQDGLKLLGRPDLNTVLTKLHVFRLASYQKIIFLDADILPLRPVSHLFHISADFAAVPDVGWPDIFNSGFLVLTPGADKFDEIMSLVKSKGSWDGGDQGVLNEWRGNGWERLSFTYNTMPTAIYTYAPAYKRFGSQISNIHFIGPDKPWKQIPLRAFTSLSPEADPNLVPSPSYAYSTLLDRWFAVYDKHYRTLSISGVSVPTAAPSASPTTGPTGTTITRQYESVWDSDMRPEVLAEVSAANAPLGLEELRRLAVEGVGESKVTEDEGVYRSMPLEGRIDLMRPAKPASTTPEDLVTAVTEKPTPPMIQIQVPSDPHTPIRSHSPAPMTTLPTPGPHELPPAPMFRGHSLPPETPTHAPHAQSTQSPVSPLRGKWPSRPTSEHLPHSPSPVHPSRAISPPLVSWNPAVEAPPNIPPPESHFPEQTYFQNVWDAPAQVQRPPESGGLFLPPPPSSIPEHLIREGHYKSVIGDPLQQDQRQHTPHEDRQATPPLERHQPYDKLQGSPSHPQPDRSKIVNVFPWEETPRRAPERFFPRTDSPPPGYPFTHPRPPALRLDLHQPRIPPTVLPPQAPDFPRTTRYGNVWDEIPSIQRYASQLVRPAPTSTLLGSEGTARGGRTRKGSAATASGVHYRSWQDQVEVSSRDADDEDEGDEEDEERSLHLVTGPGGSGEMPLKKYKMKGVQTIPRQLRHRGVQVPNGGPAVQSDPRQTRDVQREEQQERASPPALGRKLPQDVKHLEATRDPAMGTPPPQQQALEGYKGVLSQKHLEFSPTGPAISRQDKVSAIRELSPDRPISSVDFVSAQEHIASQPSLSVSSTSEGTPAFQSPYPRATALRPVSRTFDPARGVDVFKKGSEEVLARFLKMGWRDENSPSSQSLPSTI